MGGGESKPAPQPVVIEQPPPPGSSERSIVYPDRPNEPRLDGITRSLTNECRDCSLQIVPGISSSSVRISREFGSVSENDCRRFDNDLRRVRNREMSFLDFFNGLQSGRYLRNLNNGFCEQIKFSQEDADKITTLSQYEANQNKLRTIRIQKVASGGFSADTKAKITPSIPFKFKVRGQDVEVKTMTVYHPAPLRIEGEQPDAVLSLNDPSFSDNTVVLLIPLVGRNTTGGSVDFMSKIGTQLSTLRTPDPQTGQYVSMDIPTGAGWSLSKLLPIRVNPDTSIEVDSGYYQWTGMPALERVKKESPGRIEYVWEPQKGSSVKYVMLDTPIPISPTDLGAITQSLPITPPSEAIHAVLYSSDPFNRGIVHKSGPPGSCGTPTREGFTNADLNGVTEESCDPWVTWANTKNTKFGDGDIVNLVFNALILIAAGVGAYLAFSAIMRLSDVEFKNFAEGLGKLTAMFAKTLQEKYDKVKSTFQNPRAALESMAAAKLQSVAPVKP